MEVSAPLRPIVGILLFRFLHTVPVKSLFGIIPRTITYLPTPLPFFPSLLLPSPQPWAAPNKKLKVIQLFSVCAARSFPQIWWLVSLSLSAERRQVRERGEEAPSLVMPARVYHREYKSVDEDQIGFQKYKIHGTERWLVATIRPAIQLVYANFGLIYTPCLRDVVPREKRRRN